MLSNDPELEKLLKTNYIQSALNVAHAVPYGQQAEPQCDKWITDNGYVWSPSNNAYVGGNNERFAQRIVALPNNVFIWGIGDIVKILRNPDKLRLWVTGRGDDFVQKFLELTGYEKPLDLDNPNNGGDIELGEPVNRLKTYEKPPMSSEDNKISSLKIMAKKKGGLPSDMIIDLGLKAKQNGDQNMLDFLKTVKPLKENASQLSELVQAIVKTVVNEMEDDVKRVPSMDADYDLNAPHPMQHNSEDSIVLKMAQNIWGDQGFQVMRDKIGDDGRVYLLSTNKPKERHVLWKGNDGTWKYLETPAMGVKIWKDVPSDKLSEMTGTAAASPVSTPMAFSKRKIRESDEDNDIDKVLSKENQRTILAYLKQHETVNFDTLAKAISQQLGINVTGQHLYTLYLNNIVGKTIDEMTTTGDVSGFNIPAAFSKRGGSNKGLEGSESLGYTLTPIGKKEMARTADKLMNENSNPVRRQRCAKCKHLKPTDAHGYIEGWVCYDCRHKGGVNESTTKCRIKGCNAKSANDNREGLGGLCQSHVDSQIEREKKTGRHEKTIRAIMSVKESVTKPDYGTQLRMAHQTARREKNAEAMAYYETLGDTSASVPFEKFKGSWAYEQWKKRPEVQAHITKIQQEFNRSWWK